MCLSIPGAIVALEGSTAQVEIGGNRVAASVLLLEDVAVGDWVLVHAGFAIQKYDPAEAEATLRLLEGALGESREAVPE